MAPEIDQTVFSRSDFSLKLSRRQCRKQFVRSFHVGFPPAECRVDERLLCCHSFTCLPFGPIACPPSSQFLPSSGKINLRGPHPHLHRSRALLRCRVPTIPPN